MRLIDSRKHEWLKAEAERIVNQARVEAEDGSEILTPAVRGYRGLWARDLEYAAENTPEFIGEELLRQCYLRILSRQREDGAIPVAVVGDGDPHFLCWGNDKFTDSDTAQYAVKLAYDYYVMMGQFDLFSRTANALIQSMDFMPRSDNGLIWIDPENPHTAYGFTDTVVKTGNVLFSSLLYWESCKIMAEMLGKVNRYEEAEVFVSRAKLIQSNIDILWDDSSEVFHAATEMGKRIDIWGNAYAVYIGLVTGEKREKICHFLADNYQNYSFHGQIRHLPDGEFWEQTRHSETGTVPEDEYQNGGYWGTAAGWVGYALAQVDTKLAATHFNELISYYQVNGAYECVSRSGMGKMKDYVASVVNPFGAIYRLLLENNL